MVDATATGRCAPVRLPAESWACTFWEGNLKITEAFNVDPLTVTSITYIRHILAHGQSKTVDNCTLLVKIIIMTVRLVLHENLSIFRSLSAMLCYALLHASPAIHLNIHTSYESSFLAS